MGYYEHDWLYTKYKKVYENITGAGLSRGEKVSLHIFFNTQEDSLGKEIYYMAIYRLKRGWFPYLVYLIIAHKLKRAFSAKENLNTFIPLHKIFAKSMLNDALKAYCKISD